jgi:SAM-dependent methyltransferase
MHCEGTWLFIVQNSVQASLDLKRYIMKKWLQKNLVCPACLPLQVPLDLEVREESGDDIIDGQLLCAACGTHYDIDKGVAVIVPETAKSAMADASGYNSRGMQSAYLWSHYSDLFNDPDATYAYRAWAALIKPSDGIALDIGCAVGRLSFEMSTTHRRVIGIDTSFSFIEKARKLLKQRRLCFDLIVEGLIAEERTCALHPSWNYDRIDFIVADALTLPFADHLFSTVSSLNILEKVPDPLQHLREVNRVLAPEDALLAFSDPFSWDASVTDPALWIGGKTQGPFSGRGYDCMRHIFSGKEGIFKPSLNIAESGAVPWKIRKTENLWEHITSHYLVGSR